MATGRPSWRGRGASSRLARLGSATPLGLQRTPNQYWPILIPLNEPERYLELIREVAKRVLRLFRGVGTAAYRYQRARDVDVLVLVRTPDDEPELAFTVPL